MTRRTRDIYLLLAVVVSANSLLWLDSFDRYLNSRYHIYLSAYLPDPAFTPSRNLQRMLGLGDKDEQAAMGGEPEPADPAVAVEAQSQMLQAASQPAAASRVAAVLQMAAASQPQAGEQIAAASQPAASQPAAAPHLAAGTSPDAYPKVLFAGDSMMQGVAPFVISRMRKRYPHGLFVDLSKQSTGLTVKRYFDWPTKIKDETIKQAFQIVVIFLGPNDPWDIYEDRKRYLFPSDGWKEKYRTRVDEVLSFAESRGVRIIWIGLPAMREERIKLGAKIENQIFQEETKKFHFDYLSTEEFLGSLDEPYKKYIEDPEEGELVVRADDGIHFTSLGLRMISAHVEELIKKQEKL